MAKEGGGDGVRDMLLRGKKKIRYKEKRGSQVLGL